MYGDRIMDHYRRPRNEGELDEALEAEGENPSCGDSIRVFLEVEEGRIREIRHQTEACAIATASISMLSREFEGAEVEEVPEIEPEQIEEMLGTKVSPVRMKCATLGLETVRRALEDRE